MTSRDATGRSLANRLMEYARTDGVLAIRGLQAVLIDAAIVIDKRAILLPSTGNLLPCPFCGSEAVYIMGGFPDPWVCCSNESCPSQPKVEGKTMEEAKEIWNRRVAPSTDECAVCGGRASACRVLGHRPPGDKTEWKTPTSAAAVESEYDYRQSETENDSEYANRITRRCDQLERELSAYKKAWDEQKLHVACAASGCQFAPSTVECTSHPSDPYYDFVSDEPLGVIEANECSTNDLNSLTTKRFRRVFNELHRMRVALTKEVMANTLPSANERIVEAAKRWRAACTAWDTADVGEGHGGSPLEGREEELRGAEVDLARAVDALTSTRNAFNKDKP